MSNPYLGWGIGWTENDRAAFKPEQTWCECTDLGYTHARGCPGCIEAPEPEQTE